ncbi:uncharacterized mitochondrial protein AtMg00810-like [Miscanthus floridulus]|uniref:uncharacterized mitochondrial protein AtMg00810-like n=1 Tax=Miscanthus floridulus TaxID=154761 RepID=UPI003458573E
MLEEMKAIEKNETWELVDPPPGCRPIGLKWVYKVKRDERGTIVKHKGKEELVVGVYVDDLIITGAHAKDIDSFKREMAARFKMSDLGALSYYLGIEVRQGKQSISLGQRAYVENLLERGGMAEYKPCVTPMEV